MQFLILFAQIKFININIILAIKVGNIHIRKNYK